MHLWILSRADASRSTRRLEETATAAGHTVERVAFEQVTVRHAHPGPMLAGVPSSRPDLVLNRLQGDETHLRHGTRVQAALESRGVLGVNTSAAIQIGVVKSSTSQRLAAAGIPQPTTVVATVDSRPDALVEVCGTPLVLKPDRGTGAKGVVRVDKAEEVRHVLDDLATHGVRELVAQPFIPAAATTLRAVVIQRRVVAAVAGEAPEGDWRASLDVAVGVRAVTLPDHEQALAVAAATACGLHMAGIDMVRVGGPGAGPGATYVLDVASAPELRRTGEASGVDLYAATVTFLERIAQAGRLPAFHGLPAID